MVSTLLYTVDLALILGNYTACLEKAVEDTISTVMNIDDFPWVLSLVLYWIPKIPIDSASVSNDILDSAIHLNEGNEAWGGHDSRKFQPIAKIAIHLLPVLRRRATSVQDEARERGVRILYIRCWKIELAVAGALLKLLSNERRLRQQAYGQQMHF